MISFLKCIIKVIKNTRILRSVMCVISARIEILAVFCNTVVPFAIFIPSYNKGFGFGIN